MQIVDCHTHVLGSGTYEDNRRFLQDLRRGPFMARGLLPSDRIPTEQDWDAVAWLFEPIDPEVSIIDHEKAGVSRIQIMAISPSDYPPYGSRGTTDPAGVTGIEDGMNIDMANDYVASLVDKYPDTFIGFGAVNPLYRGVEAAVEELERLVLDLELAGVKLYPMFDQYSVDAEELVFPILERAQELGIPTAVHQAGIPARGAPLEWGHPMLLDKVGRSFPDLKLLVCHAGFPWLDEAILLLSRHSNFYADVSLANSLLTREEMYRFLDRCRRWGAPLSRICWGTDYPCIETVEDLVPKFFGMNEEAERLGMPPVSDEEMQLMMAGNFLRLCGLE